MLESTPASHEGQLNLRADRYRRMDNRKAFIGLCAALAATVTGAGTIGAQGRDEGLDLSIKPERTSYRETSRYTDVMEFVRRVTDRHPLMHLTQLGYSLEGRELPAVVVGRVDDGGPVAVRGSGKIRLFIQANIHAGEVAGKEAAQLLLRDIARGGHSEWLDSLVLIVAPIYNADGNERIRLTNRPYQHGPIAGMGQRANAQGLDLNRDHMKLESPEAHSLVRFWREYDPHVVMDLHTTDGSHHGYRLTYAPPLHPDTDSTIVEVLRESWFPAVTRELERKYGWHYGLYGFLPYREDAERGWYTFSHQPRYNTNYVGLRNRFAILSEAYAYATFEERVLATLRFVEETIEFAYHSASLIGEAVTRADAVDVTGSSLTLSAEYERTGPEPILMGEVVELRNPYSGRPMLRRVDVRRPEKLPVFGTFRPTETGRAPAAYLVPGDMEAVLRLLDDHGVRWATLSAPRRLVVERFTIDSTRIADREYQGHRERTLHGEYESLEIELTAGTAVVPLRQPLGRLAFALLEPRADDGLVNWNVLDDRLDGASHYPILRAPEWPEGGP